MAEIIVPFGKDNIKISNIKDFDIIDVGKKRNTSLSYQQMKEKIDKFIDGISFQGMKNIAVAIPDITRPRVPIEIFQHILKRFLSSFQGNIKIFVGTGLHNYRLSDKNELIPENLVHNDKVQVFFHDARSESNIYVGETKRGTPVFIEKDYLLSDLKISIGIVEPHQFAGFSGGAKGVVIGLGGEKTISKNHSMLIDPNSKMGLLEGNPIRE
ncbi:MAG: lactate racemase domain-containing protein, partial [Thermotogota bacterium]|nr:lactate racemase domain-containing protein [Thermotogota bacterium]